MSRTFMNGMLATGCVLGAASVLADIAVTVDPTAAVGPVKVMNAVNNGPEKRGFDAGAVSRTERPQSPVRPRALIGLTCQVP